MSTTINSIKQLYDQYSSYLSAQVLGTTLDSLSGISSGKMDSCKELVLIGTTPYGETTSGNYANITAKYYRLSIPLSSTQQSLVDLYKNTQNPSSIILSSHYSHLDSNNNTVSDIIKLDFSDKVPTEKYVLALLNDSNSSNEKLLKAHVYYGTNNVPEGTPDWLLEKPHKLLFDEVSAYIIDSIDSHNISEDAHENIFSNYYTKALIQQKCTVLSSYIFNQNKRSVNQENILLSQLDICSSALSSLLRYHLNAKNEDQYGYAHENIFNKYDKSQVVTKKDNLVKNQLLNKLSDHYKNGVTDHTTLAPKSNPYFEGDLYLNYNTNDNLDHGIYIKVSKNDFCRLGSFQTSTSTDNGGLALQTADNGNQPIVVEQYNGTFITLKNRAYLLDKDGNTKFPNNLSVGKALDVTGNITSDGTILTSNSVKAKSIITTDRSYTNTNNLSTSDSSEIIPNTEWVQKTIQARGQGFCLTQTEKLTDSQFKLLISNQETPRNLSTTQIVGYTSNITVNPNLGKLSAKQISVDILHAPSVYSSLIQVGTLKSNGVSYTSTNGLTSTDSSDAIPNTAWVQNTIQAKKEVFQLVGQEKTDNKEYKMFVQNDQISSNQLVTSLGYISNITLNPSVGRITSKQVTADAGHITQVYATSVTAPTVNGNTFTGTANKAIYDKDGIQLNTKVNSTEVSNGNYYILGTNSSGKSELSYSKNLSFNPSTQSITAKVFNGAATTAKWADLAEIYETDKDYPIGTLIQFGGEKEITIASENVNGVISDKPAFLMNSQNKGQPIALIGRVKVRVLGKVNKFDYISLSSTPGIGKSTGKEYTSNTIARALENKEDQNQSVILCSIQMHI